MKGRPQTEREDDVYLAGMSEALSYLTDEEHAWLTHPRTGLHTVCKFLPTPADVHEFLRARREKATQFQPTPTHYKRLNEEKGPWDQETDFERKARVVRELLGYNPSPAAKQLDPKRELVPPSAEDLANLKLTTPPAAPSVHLIKLLREQGYPHLRGEEQV